MFGIKKKKKSPEEFASYVTKALRDYAAPKGYVKSDVETIPELNEYAEKFVLKWMKDSRIQALFRKDADTFYYNVATYALYGGIVYANYWKVRPNLVTSGEVERRMDKNGVLETAEQILAINDARDKNKWRQFTDGMFDKCKEMFVPYRDLENSKDYAVNMIIACFHMGVMIELSFFD